MDGIIVGLVLAAAVDRLLAQGIPVESA